MVDIADCRKKYGYGFRYKCSRPVLGDVFVNENNNKVVHIVIACDDYDLTLLTIGDDQTNIIFMKPLPEKGEYTGLYVVGNLLGGINNDKRWYINQSRPYTKQTLQAEARTPTGQEDKDNE